MKILKNTKTLLVMLTAAALVGGGVFYAGDTLAGYGPGYSGGSSHSAEVPDGGKVVILSPKDGAVVKGTSVVVSYEITDKGSSGDHVHIYMDGKLVKPVRGVKNSYTIKWLKKGKHTIEVKLATSRHKILDTKDVIRITVE